MAQVSDSGTVNETEIRVAGSIDVVEPAPLAAVEPAARSKWYRWRKDGTALITYLLDSEVWR